jgi:radical SAM-linked protein
VESLAETLDLALAETPGESGIEEHLNRVLPPGLKILQVERLPGKRKPPHLASAIYQVLSPEPVFAPERTARFLAQEEVWVTRQRPKQAKLVEMRRLVSAVEVVNSREVKLTINVSEKDNLKVTEIIGAIFELGVDQSTALQVLKISCAYDKGPGKTNGKKPSLSVATASCHGAIKGEGNG